MPRSRLLVTLHSSPPFLRDCLSPWDCQNMEEATAAMQQAPSEAAATSAPSNLRFHTKNSFFLGKWTPRRCAFKPCPSVPAPKDYHYPGPLRCDLP